MKNINTKNYDEINYAEIELVFKMSKTLLGMVKLTENQLIFLKNSMRELEELYYKAKECTRDSEIDGLFTDLTIIAENTFSNKEINLSRNQWDNIENRYIIPMRKITLVGKLTGDSKQFKEPYIRTGRFFLVNGIFQIVGSIIQYISCC